ncbi:hypothetical protein F4802DRAFT_97655 [Xylaria palmicola]|nr:hypothetical protein F4802DRAFT_97655 [Xylaria palmicola]
MNDPNTAGLHTTASNPSLRPISNRTGSTRSTASNFGTHRHTLLKSNAQQQQSVEKDPPVPSALTHSRSISTDDDTSEESGPQKETFKSPTPKENTVHSSKPAAPGSVDTNTTAVAENGLCSSANHQDHFRTWRLPVSKVRSAVYNVGDGTLYVHELDSSLQSDSPKEAYLVEKHFQHNRMNTPKVRPFVEYSFVQASHPGDDNRECEQSVKSDLTDQPRSQGDEESRKTAMYWGFLPRLKERRSKKSSVADMQECTANLRSKPPSQPESQKSLTDLQPPNFESNCKPENLRQQDEMAKRDPEASDDNNEGINSAASSGEGSGRSIMSASLISPSTVAPASVRTPRWIRGLLGYSDSGDPPTLTKLPDKISPRPGARDHIGSTASEATTYTNRNTTDEKAMNNAMHGLEHLMIEALSLADAVGELRYGHVDDGGLPLKSVSESSIHTPSIHESIRRSISEDGEAVTANPPPKTFTGAPGDENYKRSYLPLESVERPGLIKSAKDGVQVPVRSSFQRIRRTASSDDDCVLPMPLPDCRVRRHSVYPGPHTYEEDDPTARIRLPSRGVPNGSEVREYIRIFHQPPISTRGSSRITGETTGHTVEDTDAGLANRLSEIRCLDLSACSLDGGTSEDVIDFSTQYGTSEKRYPGLANFEGFSRPVKDENSAIGSRRRRKQREVPTKHAHELRNISLRNRSHVSIDEGQRFSLTKSAKRQPTIARDWSPARKRFVAAVACTSTALIGTLVGIYAGLVPSIQYYIADFHHYTILGNVGLYLGMALPSLFCWPLPLLYGRKPYIVGGLCIAMPLLFPQAVAISLRRSPYTCVWRVALLLPRALMGFSLGFASMNFHSILTDLFGASLMSNNPHQELVDEYDVRRHGGGLGVWLGIWTWCFIGSLGVGFMVGAVVIEYLQPVWGLYISIIIIAVVLLLNVLCPEVRRAAWRRSVAEVRKGKSVSRRLARGEVMMHRLQTGPRWWGQEVYHGVALSLEMLRQPGFTIMAVYSAWIYAQIVLVIVLLGSLTSKSYRFRSPYVGAVVSSVAIGALAAIPFQKANLFSRARHRNPVSNVMTFDKKITWSSRFLRRAIFTLLLPIAGIVYTVVSTGPPVHIFFPSLLAALIGFLSCLAISECNGLLMEAWDSSDLQPGMTGRSKSSKDSHKRTNYSSFPRVTAGWNFIHSLGFIFAAGATGLGGSVTRRLGQREATGVVACILLILTFLLLAALIRFKRVQIIPDCTCSEMDRWTKERRASHHNWAAAIAAAKEKGSKELDEIPEDEVG